MPRGGQGQRSTKKTSPRSPSHSRKGSPAIARELFEGLTATPIFPIDLQPLSALPVSRSPAKGQRASSSTKRSRKAKQT